ncbi:MAG: FAD-binding protein [Burkholderiales bacterium]
MSTILTLPACDLAALRRIQTVRVRSADELRSALRQGRERSLALDASGLDRVLRFDGPRNTLEMQAATPWTALAEYLAPRGISLQAFARTADMPQTVGAAVSQNAAGPDGRPLCAHVAAIALVTPDGELRRADRESNRELFRLALGGHGLFGVLYSVTLRLESLQRSAGEARAPAELSIADAGVAASAGCAIECLLPPSELDAHLADVRALAEERRIALHGISVRRYLPEQDTFLPWSSREWAGVTVRFGTKPTLGARVHAAEIRRLLLAMALGRGGSFPIRDPGDATREQLEACYPALSAFLAEKRRCDPAERLQNDWYRRARAKLRGTACEVRWGR